MVPSVSSGVQGIITRPTSLIMLLMIISINNQMILLLYQEHFKLSVEL